MKNSNVLTFVMLLCFFKCFLGSRQFKPYINEFFFKLSDEKFLPIVQQRAKTLNFIWLRCLITRLHLFRKTDIPVNNEKPVPVQKVSRWMNAFGSMVEYIEQDKYIQVYPNVHDIDEYDSSDKIIDNETEDTRRHYPSTTDSQETTTFEQETNYLNHAILCTVAIVGFSVLGACCIAIACLLLRRRKAVYETIDEESKGDQVKNLVVAPPQAVLQARDSCGHQVTKLVAQPQVDIHGYCRDVYSAEEGLLTDGVYHSVHLVEKQREQTANAALLTLKASETKIVEFVNSVDEMRQLIVSRLSWIYSVFSLL